MASALRPGRHERRATEATENRISLGTWLQSSWRGHQQNRRSLRLRKAGPRPSERLTTAEIIVEIATGIAAEITAGSMAAITTAIAIGIGIMRSPRPRAG